MTQSEDRLATQVALAALRAARVTQQVSDATASVVQAQWRRINPYNAAEVREFSRQVGRMVVASQRSVATVHAAAQQVQLQAMGIHQPVTVTIPDNVRGASVTFGKSPKVHAPAEVTIGYGDGTETVKSATASPDKLFERAAETYRYEKFTGKDHAAANTAAETRIASLVDDNMILSARMASQQTLKLVSDKDARVIGYRRIIHPELSKGGVCGMCIVAADRKYHIGDLQPIHTRCNCSIAPIAKINGAYVDPGHRLNQDDLDRLYSHAKDASPDQRATSIEALTRTRYRIVQHHELGPVLTRSAGQQVPYFSTTETLSALAV